MELKRAIERDSSYVRKAFEASIDQLLQRDFVLLLGDLHEVTICHRLAVYLETWFSTYSVDCEYNRLEFDTKNSTDGSWFRPDIIVHDRLVKKENLLVVDAKCTTNREGANESDDLLTMTQDNDFDYEHGIFVVFHTKLTELRKQNGVRVSGHWRDREKEPYEKFERKFSLTDHMKHLLEYRRRY